MIYEDDLDPCSPVHMEHDKWNMDSMDQSGLKTRACLLLLLTLGGKA